MKIGNRSQVKLEFSSCFLYCQLLLAFCFWPQPPTWVRNISAILIPMLLLSKKIALFPQLTISNSERGKSNLTLKCWRNECNTIQIEYNEYNTVYPISRATISHTFCTITRTVIIKITFPFPRSALIPKLSKVASLEITAGSWTTDNKTMLCVYHSTNSKTC